MRRRGSLLRFLILASTIAFLGCGTVWAVGMVFLGAPQAITRLGPPSPALNPFQRTLLSIYLLSKESALDLPAGDPAIGFELDVLQGEPASVAVDRLQTAGVVYDGTLLRNYLRYRGLDVSVEAGRYNVYGGMTIRELASTLQNASLSADFFTVLEGWRVEEIAAALPGDTLNFEATDFLAAIHTQPPGFTFSDQLPEPPSLEGFLFPDTYHLSPELSAHDLVFIMLDNFEDQLDSELRAGFSQQGLSLYQAVTLASIVEREAIMADEQPIIASVFINRLALGMKLEADPTVQYAVGTPADGWWKTSLTFDDLEINSLYNTYMYHGLPPGPIANPGLSALRAVAFPEKTTYLYFRALCDGSGRHAFAVTYEEHQRNTCP